MKLVSPFAQRVYDFVQVGVSKAGIEFPMFEELTQDVLINRYDRDFPLRVTHWPGGLSDEQKAAIEQYLQQTDSLSRGPSEVRV